MDMQNEFGSAMTWACRMSQVVQRQGHAERVRL